MSIVIDPEQVVKTLRIITRNDPDAVVEIRLLPKKKSERVIAGYFDPPAFGTVPNLLEPILKNKKHVAYVTLHRLHIGLLARFYRRLETAPDITTSDRDVLQYRWLLIDIDPIRPAGINSTDIELQYAIEQAALVKKYFMDELELPMPIECESGNGYHLLFPIDWPAIKENVDMLKNVLKGLAKEFDSDKCKVDETVFNPARITKLYGTLAGKGDGTPDRPARMSRIVRVPEGVL